MSKSTLSSLIQHEKGSSAASAVAIKSGNWIFPTLVKILENAMSGVKHLDDETLQLFAANVERLNDEQKQQIYSRYGRFLELQLMTVSIPVETDLVSDHMVHEVLYGNNSSVCNSSQSSLLSTWSPPASSTNSDEMDKSESRARNTPDPIMLESNDIDAYLDKLAALPKTSGCSRKIKVRLSKIPNITSILNMFKLYEFLKSESRCFGDF